MVFVTCIVGYGIKALFNVDGWFKLIGCSVLLCLISIIANTFIFYSNAERKDLVVAIKSKILRNKNINRK